MDYAIITRVSKNKVFKKDYPWIDSSKPLQGFSNNKNIKINDIVGIKIQKKKFIEIDNLIKAIQKEKWYNENPQNYQKMSYDYIEEHFYKIINIIDDRIKIEPYNLLKKKVIVHSTYINSTTQITLPKESFKKEFLIEILIDICIDNFDSSSESDIEQATDYFTIINSWHLVKLHQILKKNKASFFEKKKFPRWDKIYILPNSRKDTRDYFQLISQNKNKLLNIFTETELNRLGSYNKVVLNNQSLYQRALKDLPNEIEYDIQKYQEYDSSLKKPKINPEIEYIHYPEIYRVFSSDKDNFIAKANTFKNWSNKILDIKLKDSIKVNDIIKIGLVRKDNMKKIIPIYLKVLSKIKKDKFLCITSNKVYSNSYEDIIVLIDKEQITEISGYDDNVFDIQNNFNSNHDEWDISKLNDIKFNLI